MKNIVLIGMMGCGKTTVGRILANRLRLELVDTDAAIEAQKGCSIAEIFAREGEASFRELELKMSKKLSQRRDLVIACGGGLPMRPDCIGALKRSGRVVFLDRDPGVIYDSVSMANRPLGQDGREAFLERFAQREPTYRKWADYIIKEFSSPKATAEAVLEVLK